MLRKVDIWFSDHSSAEAKSTKLKLNFLDTELAEDTRLRSSSRFVQRIRTCKGRDRKDCWIHRRKMKASNEPDC